MLCKTGRLTAPRHGPVVARRKTAIGVATGVSLGNGRALVTMKHVVLNVADDPLFTLTCSDATCTLTAAGLR